MSNQRRLIQDAAPGELRHRLLRAGRDAEPTAESRQRLLTAVLPHVPVPTLNAGASKASLKAAASSLKASLAAKLAVLSVVGASATGAWFAVEQRGADSARSAPVDPPSQPLLAAPAVPTEPQAEPSTAQAARSARQVPALPVAEAEPALEAPLPSVGPTAAPARRAATNPRPLPVHETSRQRAARVARRATLHPARDLAPAEEPRTSAALPDSQARQTEPASVPPPRLAPSTAPTYARAVQDGAVNSPDDTHLREELRELDAVRDALRSGDRASAGQRLARYLQRFPHGFLEPEARRLAQEVHASSAR